MDDVGIHHHELVGPDGEELLVDLELAVAADDVKKLGIVMGMGGGMPVSAVFGGGGVAQGHLTAGQGLFHQAEGVIGMAHGKHFLCKYIAIFYYYIADFKKSNGQDCGNAQGTSM